LAKVFSGQAMSPDLSQSPTVTDPMTAQGVILGTVPYMSPEQAKGKDADKRADIWAFGCLLYESLTGKRAFQGKTTAETIAAVLTGEPDWALVPPDTPLSARSVLRNCLQKDPNRRIHDIVDAAIGLQEPALSPPASPSCHSVWWGVAVIAAALAGCLLTLSFAKRTTPHLLVTRTGIRIGERQWFAGIAKQVEMWRPSRTAFAISSDGRFIVYSAFEGSPSDRAVSTIYLRPITRMEAARIEGTVGGISPFLSPDNKWIGFYANGKLLKVGVDGGPPAVLCDAGWLLGASWGPDDTIVFSPGVETGLFTVSADGGKPESLTM
jgi:hypothetical protein